MTNPLVGVWELVSKEEEGLFVVTDTHFVDLTVRKGRKQWPADITPTAVTDEMRAEAWRGLLFAIGGTYELTPTGGSEMNTSSITIRPSIACLGRFLKINTSSPSRARRSGARRPEGERKYGAGSHEFQDMKMQPALERALGRRGLLKACHVALDPKS